MRVSQLAAKVDGMLARRKGPSVAGTKGNRSEFWREISWRLGDAHAHRICLLVDVYCRLSGTASERFHRRVPS